MQYGICTLSIVPVRMQPADVSEMLTQLLFGEYFKILEERGILTRIRIAFDSYEGWVSNNQILKIEEQLFEQHLDETPIYSADLIEFITNEGGNLIHIPMGSVLNYAIRDDRSRFEGHTVSGINDKTEIIKTALLYLNTPYLWGGKTPFGIDCSGLTQMVYRLNGHFLKRNSAQQATQGEALSFIEESETGDLDFFDDNEGNIVHVGIMMHDNYIIHVDGKVRIDRIDHSGIYNVDLRKHTHQLRVIKKIF